jgi:predicted SnoaL-like aldol condensation-catalyzing enzyme
VAQILRPATVYRATEEFAMATTLQLRPLTGADQLETNRQIAVDFLARASAGHAHEAWDEYGSSDFVHHNPWFRGDGRSLIAAMDENARQYPQKRLEVLRTIAEGSMVAVHTRVRLEPDGSDHGIVHIFRIENGKLREMWDIAMVVPKESPNALGMF